jgi:serine/threonine protein kinase
MYFKWDQSKKDGVIIGSENVELSDRWRVMTPQQMKERYPAANWTWAPALNRHRINPKTTIGLVHDNRLDRPVLIKAIVYRQEDTETPEAVYKRRLLLSEQLNILNELQSPLLPEPLDYFEVRNTVDGFKHNEVKRNEPALILDYIPGIPLQQKIESATFRYRKRTSALNIGEICRFAQRILAFLRFLDEADYAYLDLNVEHILLLNDNIPRFVGISHLCPIKNGTLDSNHVNYGNTGTGYHPPELNRKNDGEIITSRQIGAFSLGVVLHQILIGTPNHRGKETIEVPSIRELKREWKKRGSFCYPNGESEELVKNCHVRGREFHELILKLCDPNPEARLTDYDEIDNELYKISRSLETKVNDVYKKRKEARKEAKKQEKQERKEATAEIDWQKEAERRAKILTAKEIWIRTGELDIPAALTEKEKTEWLSLIQDEDGVKRRQAVIQQEKEAERLKEEAKQRERAEAERLKEEAKQRERAEAERKERERRKAEVLPLVKDAWIRTGEYQFPSGLSRRERDEWIAEIEGDPKALAARTKVTAEQKQKRDEMDRLKKQHIQAIRDYWIQTGQFNLPPSLSETERKNWIQEIQTPEALKQRKEIEDKKNRLKRATAHWIQTGDYLYPDGLTIAEQKAWEKRVKTEDAVKERVEMLRKEKEKKEREKKKEKEKVKASKPNKSSHCFLSTAAYGTPTHPRLDLLRWFRDSTLRPSKSGRKLLAHYYKNSPAIAYQLEEMPIRKEMIRWVIEAAVFFVKGVMTTPKNAPMYRVYLGLSVSIYGLAYALAAILVSPKNWFNLKGE